MELTCYYVGNSYKYHIYWNPSHQHDCGNEHPIKGTNKNRNFFISPNLHLSVFKIIHIKCIHKVKSYVLLLLMSLYMMHIIIIVMNKKAETYTWPENMFHRVFMIVRGDNNRQMPWYRIYPPSVMATKPLQ